MEGRFPAGHPSLFCRCRFTAGKRVKIAGRTGTGKEGEGLLIFSSSLLYLAYSLLTIIIIGGF
tara:strand:+ start:574 stop:762 length:189 start_codon:yes stop_codon:yes gene_type:complete